MAVCSRISADRQGRPVVVVTTPTTLELPVGMVFVVLGNDLPCSQAGFGWLGERTGRLPRPSEQAGGAYCTPIRQRRPEPDDDELDEPAAIELARLEQQRTPADLIGKAA